MAQFKATKEFKELENKFFGIHKIMALEQGVVIEITDPSAVPKEVMACLEDINKPKPKKETKKEINKEGDK